MYADLTGNRKKRRIKSFRDNKCEGRMIYDCFVLNEKRNAIFYQGSQAVLGMLDVRTFASDVGKTSIMVNGSVPSGYELSYYTGTSVPAVTYEQVIQGGTTTGWTAMTTNPVEITPTSGHTMVTVIMADTTNHKTYAVGSAIINIG